MKEDVNLNASIKNDFDSKIWNNKVVGGVN